MAFIRSTTETSSTNNNMNQRFDAMASSPRSASPPPTTTTLSDRIWFEYKGKLDCIVKQHHGSSSLEYIADLKQAIHKKLGHTLSATSLDLELYLVEFGVDHLHLRHQQEAEGDEDEENGQNLRLLRPDMPCDFCYGVNLFKITAASSLHRVVVLNVPVARDAGDQQRHRYPFEIRNRTAMATGTRATKTSPPPRSSKKSSSTPHAALPQPPPSSPHQNHHLRVVSDDYRKFVADEGILNDDEDEDDDDNNDDDARQGKNEDGKDEKYSSYDHQVVKKSRKNQHLHQHRPRDTVSDSTSHNHNHNNGNNNPRSFRILAHNDNHSSSVSKSASHLLSTNPNQIICIALDVVYASDTKCTIGTITMELPLCEIQRQSQQQLQHQNQNHQSQNQNQNQHQNLSLRGNSPQQSRCTSLLDNSNLYFNSYILDRCRDAVAKNVALADSRSFSPRLNRVMLFDTDFAEYVLFTEGTNSTSFPIFTSFDSKSGKLVGRPSPLAVVDFVPGTSEAIRKAGFVIASSLYIAVAGDRHEQQQQSQQQQQHFGATVPRPQSSTSMISASSSSAATNILRAPSSFSSTSHHQNQQHYVDTRPSSAKVVVAPSNALAIGNTNAFDGDDDADHDHDHQRALTTATSATYQQRPWSATVVSKNVTSGLSSTRFEQKQQQQEPKQQQQQQQQQPQQEQQHARGVSSTSDDQNVSALVNRLGFVSSQLRDEKDKTQHLQRALADADQRHQSEIDRVTKEAEAKFQQDHEDRMKELNAQLDGNIQDLQNELSTLRREKLERFAFCSPDEVVKLRRRVAELEAETDGLRDKNNSLETHLETTARNYEKMKTGKDEYKNKYKIEATEKHALQIELQNAMENIGAMREMTVLRLKVEELGESVGVLQREKASLVKELSETRDFKILAEKRAEDIDHEFDGFREQWTKENTDKTRRIADLTQRLEGFNRQHSDSAVTAIAATRELDTAKQEIDGLRTQILELTLRFEAEKKRCDELTHDKMQLQIDDSFRSKALDLTRQNMTLMHERDKLKQKIWELERDLSEATMSLQVAQAKYRTQKEVEMQNGTALSSNTRQLLEENAELQAKLSGALESENAAKTAFTRLTVELDDARSKSRAADDRSKLREDQLEATIADLRQQLLRKDELVLAGREDQHSALKRHLLEMQARERQRSDDVQIKLDQMRKEQEERNRLDIDRTSFEWRSKLDGVNFDLERLRTKCGDLEKENRELKEVNEKLELARNQHKLLRSPEVASEGGRKRSFPPQTTITTSDDDNEAKQIRRSMSILMKFQKAVATTNRDEQKKVIAEKERDLHDKDMVIASKQHDVHAAQRETFSKDETVSRYKIIEEHSSSLNCLQKIFEDEVLQHIANLGEDFEFEDTFVLDESENDDASSNSSSDDSDARGDRSPTKKNLASVSITTPILPSQKPSTKTNTTTTTSAPNQQPQKPSSSFSPAADLLLLQRPNSVMSENTFTLSDFGASLVQSPAASPQKGSPLVAAASSASAAAVPQEQDPLHEQIKKKKSVTISDPFFGDSISSASGDTASHNHHQSTVVDDDDDGQTTSSPSKKAIDALPGRPALADFEAIVNPATMLRPNSASTNGDAGSIGGSNRRAAKSFNPEMPQGWQEWSTFTVDDDGTKSMKSQHNQSDNFQSRQNPAAVMTMMMASGGGSPNENRSTRKNKSVRIHSPSEEGLMMAARENPMTTTAELSPPPVPPQPQTTARLETQNQKQHASRTTPASSTKAASTFFEDSDEENNDATPQVLPLRAATSTTSKAVAAAKVEEDDEISDFSFDDSSM